MSAPDQGKQASILVISEDMLASTVCKWDNSAALSFHKHYDLPLEGCSCETDTQHSEFNPDWDAFRCQSYPLKLIHGSGGFFMYAAMILQLPAWRCWTI